MLGMGNRIFKIFCFSGLCVVMIILMSSNPPENWIAPESAKAIVNPLRSNETATSEGKKIYTNLCVVCHGNKGKGDGIAGMTLKPRPSNLAQPLVQNQTDGEIFWKITTGKAPMAAYKELLTDEQRWQLVNYLRELKK
jgi:mono/diheme cytochrome c family protein